MISRDQINFLVALSDDTQWHCAAPPKVDYENSLEKFECHKKKRRFVQDLQDSLVIIKEIVILAK